MNRPSRKHYFGEPFLSLTPGPPPFSAMNSTPAADIRISIAGRKAAGDRARPKG
jgi:hypothetical protein